MISRTLGDTFQYTSAEDDALYERAKKKGMTEVVEYYENGGKRKKMPAAKRMIYKRALKTYRQLRKKYLVKDIVDHFGWYKPLFDRLSNKQFNKVPISKAQTLADFDGEIEVSEPEGPSEEAYQKAQRLLRQFCKESNPHVVAQKYGWPYRKVYNIVKDNYSNPHPLTDEIIEVLG
jgi:hypothetical protein